IIICSIENIDPMGVHTGDSITVAPAQTLTDKEYQRLRDASIAVLRKIGVDTGGSNVQFGVNAENGRVVVIEMNPRVSRSSALASKATGFPIAKVAAKLAVGYTLDELRNEITGGKTPASFEPSIDYIVIKIPRFAFEKFPSADARLTTQMKSVGEVMAIGRTFQESLQKALRGLETGKTGLDPTRYDSGSEDDLVNLRRELKEPGPDRLFYVGDAFRAGLSLDEIFNLTHIDRWFLDQMAELIEIEAQIKSGGLGALDAKRMYAIKRKGFSDARIAALVGTDENAVRRLRHAFNVHPVYKRVDSCAAEFATTTAYMYSTYEEECEANPSNRDKIMVLGGGPNRIGQGIEFDYCCVHAALAMREDGYETLMVNCNPETVSTDYDTADRLYFEPLTFEDVLEVFYAEAQSGEGGPGVTGVIVQLGGQTPLGLAQRLADAGVPIVGTPPEAIDLAEDRGAFGDVLTTAGLPAPKYGTATTFAQARRIAEEIGYPVLVRPSYVLGGRGMEIVYDEETLEGYIARATELSPEHPVLVDRFLEDAVEIDVDALCDGTEVYIGGIMEHIEEAGIHSGDSACALPPVTLGRSDIEKVRKATEAIAHGIGVVGLLNVQYALKDDVLYVLEANPRASRTVPFVSKATAIPLAKACARIMLGATVTQLRDEGLLVKTGDGANAAPHAPIAVKEAVLPFHRFRRADGAAIDSLLGPEMKSTGEVMGIDRDFGTAFAKSQTAAYGSLPAQGTVFVSVANRDKRSLVFPVKRLADLGFRVLATEGTAEMLRRNGIPCDEVRKHFESPQPGRPEMSAVDAIRAGDVDMVINTPYGNSGPRIDGYEIRSAAVAVNIPCVTTVQGASAAVQGIEAGIRGDIDVRSLQELHSDMGAQSAGDVDGQR
ncbi:MAG: carbamoyl-phosphate synthase large subunit, partial [Mycobacterium sp.]|uniref:carbamoyl-phosphate synthase large subunit n=1 Tax=Mycobacterium sp. TaxID=1785 RepID=UPI001EC5B38F